jgi:hypothetical protein
MLTQYISLMLTPCLPHAISLMLTPFYFAHAQPMLFRPCYRCSCLDGPLIYASLDILHSSIFALHDTMSPLKRLFPHILVDVEDAMVGLLLGTRWAAFGLLWERDGLPFTRNGLLLERDVLPLGRNGLLLERDVLPLGCDGLLLERDVLPLDSNGLLLDRDGLPR